MTKIEKLVLESAAYRVNHITQPAHLANVGRDMKISSMGLLVNECNDPNYYKQQNMEMWISGTACSCCLEKFQTTRDRNWKRLMKSYGERI